MIRNLGAVVLISLNGIEKRLWIKFYGNFGYQLARDWITAVHRKMNPNIKF